MGYLAIVFLLAACAVVLVAWSSNRHRRHEVIGSEISYQPDRHRHDTPL